jgi:lipid-A-disaccharide synthase
VIFPFEEAIYQKAGVPVEFVGHPLVDLALSEQPRSAFLRDRGLVPGAPTVALLPGSRPNELRRIAPVIVEALPRIAEQLPDVQFLVACAPNLPDTLFAPFLTERRVRRGNYRIRHRYGPGGAARTADGRRLQAVAVDLPDR